jgi:hypothetical protein
MGGFKTPVALFNFNRPHLTRQVFEVIRQIKPERLLLVADGPRADRPDDAQLCAEVRALFDEIDWDCKVSRNFSDTNMGSFKRNSSGLNWVFDTVEEAIILEDDCLPDPTFFRFCEELLERYRYDTRIAAIGGFNNLTRENPAESYFFSRYPMSWGWATWRRTWNLVDLDMKNWPNFKVAGLSGIVPERWIRSEWAKLFDAIYAGERRNGWDYQLLLACWMNNMLCITPNISLIQNIGYGQDATHTHNAGHANSYVKFRQIKFPLSHPQNTFRDVETDKSLEKIHFDHNVMRLVSIKIRSTMKLFICIFMQKKREI